MRPEPNKEIDLLLRQLASRNGALVSEIEERHLDADELNSYVANALPAPARARYTEHLADCSSCRKTVALLSAAQDPVAVQQSAPVVAPSGLKSFLASLFSPMVLRYAVPALGLIVIAVVGIVVMQRDRRGADVAQITDTDQKESALQSPIPEATVEADKAVAKSQAPPRGFVAPVAKDAAGRVANQPADAVTTAEAPPPPKAAVETEVAPVQESQKEKKAEAPEPTANAPDAAKQRADEPARNRSKKLDEVAATPGTSTRPAKRSEIRAAKSAEGTATGTASVSPTATVGRDYNAARDEAKDNNFSSETRSVAGRRFRKSDGVWIDTAYNASSAVTNVARGSEQYRALIADEPSIRTIAEELGGQIIVVWKGRTYRIR